MASRMDWASEDRPPRSRPRPRSTYCAAAGAGPSSSPTDTLYARTLTRHALLQSSLSLPAPLERSPLFLSRSASSLDILPPRHRPLFAAREEEKESIQDTFL